jgi:lipoprotein-releasing system permease protein
MPFELLVALRFLREGRFQTILLIAGVGVGVAVMVFLSALITGLQKNIIQQTLGTQAHIVLRVPEDAARRVIDRNDATVLSETVRAPQRLRAIESWPNVVTTASAFAGVRGVAPTLSGSAFASRGNANNAIQLYGVDPDSYRNIVDVASKLVSGEFVLTSDDAVIGRDLADDLGVSVGDKIRLSTTGERALVATVRGVFDLKNQTVNERWVFVPLRSAQTLLDLAGGVTAIEVVVDEIFSANTVADGLHDRTGLTADSWMRTNQQLLVALRSQSSSSAMIQFFVVLAVALGIASVLVVSVVQKSKEIGILKAMGALTRRVNGVFLLQGGIVGLGGSIIGCAIGALLAVGFAAAARNADGSPLFPITLDMWLFGRAVLIATVTGVLAAIMPARRAAKLDPAVVIRYG